MDASSQSENPRSKIHRRHLMESAGKGQCDPLVVDWLPHEHLAGLDAVGDSPAGEGVLCHLVQRDACKPIEAGLLGGSGNLGDSHRCDQRSAGRCHCGEVSRSEG